DCGHDRICACRLAPHARLASIVSRFRVVDRLGADGAGIELCGFLWSQNGASLVEAATRNCLWGIPDTCIHAIYSKPAMSVGPRALRIAAAKRCQSEAGTAYDQSPLHRPELAIPRQERGRPCNRFPGRSGCLGCPGQLTEPAGNQGCLTRRQACWSRARRCDNSDKTTALRIMAGLEPVSSGRVVMDAADVTHKEPGERDVAMVFQSYALNAHMTVGQIIGFPLEMVGVKPAEKLAFAA